MDMDHIVESGVRNLLIIGHLPVYVIKKKIRNKKVDKIVKTRNLIYEEFQSSVGADVRWFKFWFRDETFDELWKTLYDILLESIDHMRPELERRIQDDKPACEEDD